METATAWTAASSSLTAAATAYTKTGLLNGTTYEFRLKAKDAAGNWSAYTA